MKIISMVLVSAIAGVLPAHAADTEALSKEARGISMNFGKTLKGKLMEGMKAGGPIKALEVCNINAPLITSAAGDSSGWNVARTSLKLRNPGNAPDQWEQEVLQRFEKTKMSGEEIKKIEFAEVVEVNGKKTFRFMKAIPTEGACVQCHGAVVAPEVEAKLKELYPQDKARGFAPGDIRGAFTLQKTL